MSRRYRLAFCFITLLPFIGFAQESDNEEVTDETLLGLLEFLGEFETADGEWLNPDDLITENYAELDESTTTNEDDD